MIDKIADLITRIRNAGMRGKSDCLVPHSAFKMNFLKILQKIGYISSFKIVDNSVIKKNIIVELKYFHNKHVISSIKKISKSGCRVYMSNSDILLKYKNMPGKVIVSTSFGMKSIDELNNLGGEVICYVE